MYGRQLCYRGDLYETIKHPESTMVVHCSHPRHVDGIIVVCWNTMHVKFCGSCTIGRYRTATTCPECRSSAAPSAYRKVATCEKFFRVGHFTSSLKQAGFWPRPLGCDLAIDTFLQQFETWRVERVVPHLCSAGAYCPLKLAKRQLEEKIPACGAAAVSFDLRVPRFENGL